MNRDLKFLFNTRMNDKLDDDLWLILRLDMD
jgi:hypothetical protein